MKPDRPASSATKRCTPSPTANLALPIAGQATSVKMKKSAMGPRRAAVLIAVHVFMVAHFLHYLSAGRTLSPIEPSEAMYTLRDGLLNAGFIFFATALLATLIFGRFVCGWGCHLVAYQDLCGWLMKKINIKPKPLRSRLLIFAPLILALYMFVYPSVYRALFPSPHTMFPGLTNHLLTDDYWKTFPGPVFAVISVIVCGFAAVYFLGAKGFCTYACPYGGFFAPIDKVSVGKILVTDACEQCGHCTANCTSNVRVHEEVKRYGMVVDPGCMKCLDCVSVCPNDALYFGFASPSVITRPADTSPPKRRYDFSLTEEVVMSVIFLATTLSMRGLYDGPPLLVSVALGGIIAYLAMKLWRLLRDPTVRVQNLKLKTAGSLTRAGRFFIAATTLWIVFTIHSGFVQWHRAWGAYYLERTEATQNEVFSGASKTKQYSDKHAAAAQKCFDHFSKAERWGLVATPEVKLGLAWSHLLRQETEPAERLVRECIAANPDNRGLYDQLAKLLLLDGRPTEAVDVMQSLINRGSPTAQDHFRLAVLLTGLQRPDEAIDHYRACIQLAPDAPDAYYNLGGLLGRIGRFDEAIDNLLHAQSLMPQDPDTAIELGLAYAAAGRINEAIQSLRLAIELAPDDPEPRMQLDVLLRRLRGNSRSNPG